MALVKGKHTIAEIEGTRCTVVETGITEERTSFLRGILEFNGYSVKAEKEKAKDGTLLETSILGVTDLIFNPMIVVYQHKLFLKDGKEVTPAYWNQWSGESDLPYWQVKR